MTQATHNTPLLATDPAFSPDSKVWVYTASRTLNAQEAAYAQQNLDAFCAQWTAHNHALKARGEMFDRQFLFLMVDESQAGASGCSIDKSVHFIEQLGEALRVDFFERMRFAWVNEAGDLQYGPRSEFSESVVAGTIGADTLVADTLIQTKAQLTEKWLIPFGKSWHRRLTAV